MRLSKRNERILTSQLVDMVEPTTGDRNICYECNFINDISNKENEVELIWLETSFSKLLKDYMKKYEDMPEIDEDFKRDFVEYLDKNKGSVIPWCWECQFEQG